MKPALALTLVSSITCLWAWDAEARPAVSAHAHHAAAKSADARSKPSGKEEAKSSPRRHSKGHHKAKKEAKPAAKAPARAVMIIPPVAWKIGDGPDITLKAKVESANEANKPQKPSTHPRGAAKAKSAGDLKGASSAKKGPVKKSFWLAAEPHLPLAIVDGAAIRSVALGPKACGAEKRWAQPKSHWKAVNEWGQVTGSFEVSRSETNDENHCREVFFKGQASSQPHALFVAEESGWRPSPSAAWTPSEGEVKHFEHLLGTIDETWIDGKPRGKVPPLAKRTMFFELPPSEQSSAKRPTHWAVAGGPVLVVAYLGERGHWKASEVKTPRKSAEGYKPIGVFDMNGDGIPEIVYHLNDGPDDADKVLSLDPATMSWIDAANSPTGSTP